ncbi:MAG: AAA family ATPase [Longimicrobiales bacterium]|nr:AAA family ATPase [Longimicrobiales bacterium]
MASDAGEIVVLAGVNGAGKSSVAGAALERVGGTLYDPDKATRAFMAQGLTQEEANARAWHRGREQLEDALRDGRRYAFETTLGGRTMTRLLLDAATRGRRVRVWYVGLASLELHMKRVKERVERGGHDIPEARIRERWDSSRENLVRFLPHLAELVVFDNSRSVAVEAGEAPEPVKLLHLRDGRLGYVAPLDDVPTWAKSIVEAALRIHDSA